MTLVARDISLDDKFTNMAGSVYMTGIQTLVRIALDRGRLDRQSGLKTGGFISGYRGSPLGGFDQQLEANQKQLDALDIVFQPGVNEELGAAAVWGSQKLHVAGKGSDYDGVFGIWYGKAPGVDRAGDALKQANTSGTAAHGGVLALAGDDHMAKSSILPAQSEFSFANFEMPVFNPADLQDVLDYGLHALELSRFSGLWSGMICLADTMDASGVVNVDPTRLMFRAPADRDPRKIADLNPIFLLRNRVEAERLLREIRIPAAKTYVRANGLDRIAFGARKPRIGIAATGKAYRDLRQALALLGIDEDRAKAMGLAIYKIAVPWPLEPIGISSFARGLERLLVVEHKRAFIEPQIKDILYSSDADRRLPVWGKNTPDGTPLLSDLLELTAAEMVPALLTFLPETATDREMRAVAERLEEQRKWAESNASGAGRMPYFCSGCPHSTSIKTPSGSRAMPGIGCHGMTEIGGFATEGQVMMGGEGVPWVGQAPFARDTHMFANLGDGTYYHSGLLAIRQSISAKAPITYKILYNDAVAMTGGQRVDGPLSVPQITRQLEAEGVEKIVIVSERPELYEGRTDLAPGVPVHHRDALLTIEKELSEFAGVSVIIYEQTCAAEKRRRRKKGAYEDPPKRLFINERVCEDCGDCSVQSNCVSVEPLETEFGRKRRINQSSCNKDYSCASGFCPSFVWVEGGAIRKADGGALELDSLIGSVDVPATASLDRPLNLLITGIGGMGVTTTAAVLAMAAHLDGANASTLDMTGLAQKGGPVTSHVRFSMRGTAIEGPRIPAGSLDVLLATDMLVAAGVETLTLMNPARTATLGNGTIAPTAEFTIKQTLSYNDAKIAKTLQDASKSASILDLAGIAEKLLGDTIFTNMLAVGMAWQNGLLPISLEAMETAIRLNGAAIERNLKAFHAGRVLAVSPEKITALMPAANNPKAMTLEERISFLAKELDQYQNTAYGDRYRQIMSRVVDADAACGAESMQFSETVAESLYRVMAVKDEYEVARLYSDPAFMKALGEQFEGVEAVKFVLAPPFVPGTDLKGRPKKRTFGPWMLFGFKMLARLKPIRGTWIDPFARLSERKAERRLREQYVDDVERSINELTTARYGVLCEIAKVPQLVRGYGPVKDVNMSKAQKHRAALLSQLERPAPDDAAFPFAEAAE